MQLELIHTDEDTYDIIEKIRNMKNPRLDYEKIMYKRILSESENKDSAYFRMFNNFALKLPVKDNQRELEHTLFNGEETHLDFFKRTNQINQVNSYSKLYLSQTRKQFNLAIDQALIDTWVYDEVKNKKFLELVGFPELLEGAYFLLREQGYNRYKDLI